MIAGFCATDRGGDASGGLSKGHDALAALVDQLGLDPFSGVVVVFRPKRLDRIKVLWSRDGSGAGVEARRLAAEKVRTKALFGSAPLAAATEGRPVPDFIY